MADWSSIPGNPEIKVFHDHVAELEPLFRLMFSASCASGP